MGSKCSVIKHLLESVGLIDTRQLEAQKVDGKKFTLHCEYMKGGNGLIY